MTYEENHRLRKAVVISVLKAREKKSRLAKTEEKILEDTQLLKHDISTERASLQGSASVLHQKDCETRFLSSVKSEVMSGEGGFGRYFKGTLNLLSKYLSFLSHRRHPATTTYERSNV